MMAESPMYTCLTCRVAFTDPEVQRSHYKTDWHRYNLKRKVADMPPVSAENFQQRVLAQRAQAGDEKSLTTRCILCNKQFSTKNQFDNHLTSKKHRDIETKHLEKIKNEIINQGGTEETKEQQKNAVNQALKDSLVAIQRGVSVESKTSSKESSKHGETTNVDNEEMEAVDDDDVESWDSDDDGDSMGIEECLFCSHIGQSLEGNLGHMTTAHSFFIPDAEYLVDLEGLITYLGEKVAIGNVCLWCGDSGKRFHTRQSVQRHMCDKGHCKMLHEGDTLIEYDQFYDYRSSYPDFDGNEGGAEGGASEPMDEDVRSPDLDGEGFELVLPTGAIVGHRSLNKYYKQNIPHRDMERTKSIMPRLLAQYKALGWTGMSGEMAQKKAADIHVMKRTFARQHMNLGVKANKLQKHFRCDVFG